ncbi:MAG: histidinol-phosphatase [Spirochaetes bacterium]|nr:histidinol-phosphatase [Spirochaetota bacterium]
MKYFNYHTHTDYCDGKGTLEENIISAVSSGITDLGFSSHAPVYFNPAWTMKEDRFASYKSEISGLKKKYENRISIFTGLEVDYIPGITGPGSENIISKNLDYTIGAVHVLGRPDDDSLVPITGNSMSFEKSVNEKLDGDVVFSVKEYFRLLREMLINEPPDILAHFDLIKKINVDYVLFDENSTWYLNEIYDTLDVLKRTDVITEINTGALTRKKADSLFPSDLILNELCAGKMPVTVNSDSHSPSDICGLYPETFIKISKTGFKSVKRFVSRGCWTDYEIVT